MDDGTQGNPFDSLDDVPNLEDQIRIGLERGSVFRDGYLSGAPANATVSTYGVGEPPLIDLSDRVDASAWTAVDGTVNVYRVEVPVPTFRNVPENEVQEQLYENGTELPAQDTVADVEETPGSFFLDRGGAPWQLYYHSTDSADPRESQKTVAYAARPIGINLTGIGASGEGGRVEGIKIRRPLGFRGCAAVGAGGTIERCLFYEGGKHHTVHPGGMLRDTIFVRSTTNRRRVFASACVWFQGQGVDEKQPVHAEYVIFRNLKATPFDHHTQGAGWETPSRATGTVLWKTPHPGQLPAPLVSDGGYSYHSRGGITRAEDGNATYRRYLIDGLGAQKGADLIRTDFTIEDSVVVDEILSRQPASGTTITIRNCVIVGAFLQDQSGNRPTILFENCVFLALSGEPVTHPFDLHPDTHHCLFFSGRSDEEVWFLGQSCSLSKLQSDTGAFQNSAWMSAEQFWEMYPEWRRGNFLIPSGAEVTHADGTVSTTLPDGTPIEAVGPQTHWDWNNREVAEGSPTQWPTPPITEEEDNAYSQNPQSWNWKGTPVDHRKNVSLSEGVTAFWPMNGERGDTETDLVGENPLSTVGGAPSGGTASHWSYRSFDGENDYLQQDMPSAVLNDLPNLWISVPLRPKSNAKQYVIQGRVIGDTGFELKLQSDGGLTARMHLGFSGPIISVSTRDEIATEEWTIVQFWYSRSTGKMGIQNDGNSASVKYGAHNSFIRTLSAPFTIGAKNNGGWNFEGDIGPMMLATLPPQPEDRDWVYNEGTYRSLTEFENRTVEVLDI